MKKKKVLELLNYWLKPREVILNDFRLEGHLIGNNQTRRIFVERGSDILFMAHIDTVQIPQLKKDHKTRIWAAGLDDRLGCAVASELSRELGADLLITDFEESAASTGQYHELKDYNWIAEFDRSGGDVVTYDLDSQEFLEGLEKYFEVGWGTFSDICMLNTEICCVNVGIGYEHDHSEDSYMDLGVLNSQISKFKNFYKEFKNTAFKQDFTGNTGYNPYRDYWGKNYRNECDFCGNLGAEEVFNTQICETCFKALTTDYLYS